jgi:hypothetical protein
MVSPSLTPSLAAARHLPMSRSRANGILLQIEELRALTLTSLDGETGSACQPAWQPLVVVIDPSGREMIRSFKPVDQMDPRGEEYLLIAFRIQQPLV